MERNHKVFIQDNEELIRILDEYLLKDIPISSFLASYSLTFSQMKRVKRRIKGFICQKEKIDEMFAGISFYSTDALAVSYLVESHSIKEENVLKPEESTQLFMRLCKLKDKLNLINSNEERFIIEEKCQALREKIILGNISLVHWCIRQFFNAIPLLKEDTEMVGMEGLIFAVDAFDYKKGNLFSSYAVPVIVRHIRRHFSELYGISWRSYLNTVIPNSTKEKRILELPMADVYPQMSGERTRKREMPFTSENYAFIDNYEDEIWQIF